MSYRSWIGLVALISVCPLTVCAAAPGRSTESGSPPAVSTASRLTAEAQLARYATYYAASFTVRDLGRRMTAVIQQRAAEQHVLLPSTLNESDRRIVQRLESQQGDDFDSAYMTLIGAEARSCPIAH